MQKLILCIMALLCLMLSRLSAQNQNPEAKLLDMLSTLDMTEIRASTGIFIDRVPSYVPLRHFKGSVVTDSTHVSPLAYNLAYDMLSLTHLGGSAMYPPDSIDAKVAKFVKAPVVHLGLMAYQYDRFKTDALTSGLVTYDGERFQDGADDADSPYVVDTVFMGINHKASYASLTVPYYIAQDFVSTNLGDIAAIDIDYGNGGNL